MTVGALVIALLELAGGAGSGVRRADAERLAPVLLREAGAVSPPFDPVLLAAVAWVESGYRQGVVGAAGERGVFQVKPDGMARYLCRGLQLSSLHENARCAVRLLANARRVCGGSEARWLSSFNGARGCRATHYADRVLAIRRRVR